MLKKLILSAILFTSIHSFAQHFETGHFVPSSGEKVECLIDNKDWRNSPFKFTYKLTENGEEKVGNVSKVNEFKVGKFHFFKVNVLSQKTSFDEFSGEEIIEVDSVERFAQLLANGKAKLAQVVQPSRYRYFISVENEEFAELVYEKKDEQFGKPENFVFRQQLLDKLGGPELGIAQFQNLQYRSSALSSVVTRFNDLNGGEEIIEKKGDNQSFASTKLWLRGGIRTGKMKTDNTVLNEAWEFGPFQSIQVGFQIESILPFNHQKWSIAISPSIHSSTTNKLDPDNYPGDEPMSYRSLEIPIGAKYRFKQGGNHAIYLGAAYMIDLPFSGSHMLERDINSTGNIAVSLGAEWKDRYQIELLFTPNRELMASLNFWSSTYTYLALNAGFKLAGGQK